MSRPTSIADRTHHRTREPLELGRLWPPRPILSPMAPLLDKEKIKAYVWIRDNLDPLESADGTDPDLYIEVSTCSPLETLDGRELGVRFDLHSVGRPSRKFGGGWECIELEGSFDPRDQRQLAMDARWTRAILKIQFKDSENNIASFFTWFYLGMGRQQLDPADKTLHRWKQADGGTVMVDGLQRAWLNTHAERDFKKKRKTTPGCWLHHGSATNPATDRAGDMAPPTVLLVPEEPDPCRAAQPPNLDGKAPLAIHRDGRFIDGADRTRAAALGIDPAEDNPTPTHVTALDRDGVDRSERVTPSRVVDHPWLELRGRGSQRREVVVREGEERGREEPVGLQLEARRGGFTVLRLDVAAKKRRVGGWEGSQHLAAGEPWQVGVDLDVAEFTPDEQTLLSVTAIVRPDIGAFPEPVVIDVDEAPYVVGDLLPKEIDHPWLILDIGTDASCAALACRVKHRTRVFAVRFDGSLLLPTRVWFARREGRWGLVDEPADDALVSPLVKLAFSRGEDYHPACPEHVASSRVALAFVRRLVRMVKDSARWFPFDKCRVLATFPPRLACMPKYSRTLRRVLTQALEHELDGAWADRISFREEALLVAFPVLGRFEAGSVVYVVDCGGGTTDVCHFRLNPHPDGHEGFVVDSYRYPDIGESHLAGGEVTEAFYAHLRGLLAGENLSIPRYTRPLKKHSEAQKRNQEALSRLAEWTKCHPEMEKWPDALKHLDLFPETADGGGLAEGKFLWEYLENHLGQRPPQSIHDAVLDEDLRERLDALAGAAFADAKALAEAGERVCVVVAGRASQFGPLHDALKAAAPTGARFERLDGKRLRSKIKAAGRGVIDDATVLKTATALGGAVVAINSQLDPDHVARVLEPSAPGFDCPLFLESEDPDARWKLTEAIRLEPGAEMELEPVLAESEDGEEQVFGNVELTVRGHEITDAYAVVGSGFIPKHKGRRRTLGAGWKLVAREHTFELHPPEGEPMELENGFVRLPLLGRDPA